MANRRVFGENLGFIDALISAKSAAKSKSISHTAIVHLMGDDPKYGYEVAGDGQVRLDTNYDFSETVTDLCSKNWMVSLFE